MRRKMYFIITFTILLGSLQVNAQWESIGPEGGRVNSMAQSDSAIYAVTGFYWMSKSQLFKSIDEGSTWVPIVSNSLPSDIRAIAVMNDTLFLGTGSGVYRSDDDGKIWTLKSNGFNTFNQMWINHLAVSGNAIFAAGTNDGLLKSDDKGENWTVSTNGLDDTYLYSLVANETAIFAGTGDQYLGVFRSTDNGSSWQQVSNGMAYYYEGEWLDGYAPMITALGFCGTDLYAGTDEYQGIWKSSNNGDSWVITNNQTMSINYISAIGGSGSVVLAGARDGVGVIKSSDGGVNWELANSGISNYGMVTSFLSTNEKVLVSTKAGVYSTTNNGNNWLASSSGINAHQIISDIIVNNNDIYVGTHTGGVFKSSDIGVTWGEVNNGLPMYQWNLDNIKSNKTALFAFDRVLKYDSNAWEMASAYSPGTTNQPPAPKWIEHGAYWYALDKGANLGVYRSDDHGQNWTAVNNGLPIGGSFGLHCIFTNGDALILGTTTNLFYSTNDGDTWSIGEFPGLNYWSLNAAKFASGGGVSVLGLFGYGGSRGIFTSLNNGAIWTKVSDLLVHKFEGSGNKLWAGGTIRKVINGQEVEVPSILFSNDYGQSWSDITKDGVYTSEFTSDGDNLYITVTIAPKYGVYRTSNNGESWVDISEGLPNDFITQLKVINGKIFAGTRGLSLYVRDLNDFDVPSQPSVILGNDAPCHGSSSLYSVANVLGETYTWQVPSGWLIASGQGSSAITVVVGGNNGVISVTPSNAFGVGPVQTAYIVPSGAPLQPVSIMGSDFPCFESVQNYSVASQVGATFAWAIPSNWSILSGEGTNEITVSVGSEPGIIMVTPSNACGEGPSQSIYVTTSQIPLQPSEISGSTNPASGSIQFYSVAITNGVTYTWSVPSDWVINSGQNTNFLVVTVGAASGVISCTPSNLCGFGNPSTLIVDVATGLNELNNSIGIKIYPNPTSGNVKVLIPNGRHSLSSISVLSTVGVTVLQISSFEDRSEASFSVGHLAKGTYIVRVVMDGGEVATSVLVIK
jgi:photosystem II stability/assembly factor-like uncharacterized protein